MVSLSSLETGQVGVLETHVSLLKEKEHTQGKCHQKDAPVDNIDIPFGVGAQL